MKDSSQEEQRKRKVNKVKTFVVPLHLGEITENISINSSNQTAEKQIINKAFNFHSQGNISKAAKYYQYFIDQGFNDERVFNNYGVILRQIGKTKEAQNAYHKAIELNPDFPDAYYNLGNIFRDFRNFKAAENFYRKAIKLNPDLENAHINLGVLLRDIGKLKEAELSIRQAINLNPDFPDSYYNLGLILKDLDKLPEAFEYYLKAIEVKPKLSKTYEWMTIFLTNSDTSKLNKSKLKNILNILLERDDLLHNNLFIAFNNVYGNELKENLKKLESNFLKEEALEFFSNDRLLINSLKKIIFKDIRLEKVLTIIRKKLCKLITYRIDDINKFQLQFVVALAEQCFLNEYVYSLTKEENISIKKIINRCKKGELNETNISILSCYFPLYKLLDQIPSLESFNSSNQSFKELVKLQISEPLIEIELSKKIKRIGSIDDDISKKVKSQYEEHPYPRWRYGNTNKDLKISVNQRINDAIKPNWINYERGNDPIEILVAGCGTGQHILNTQDYNNAQITGIDLSLSSLAYAKRKINELKINNVKLVQMDILEADLLKKHFDIIESSGVLHHMKDPLQGLKALLAVLKPNGLMKLGLYSKLARKNIIKCRNYIAKNDLEANENNVRNFRDLIIEDKLKELNLLKFNPDFYTVSTCRDLCFHAQEQQFTIKQLQETLNYHQLRFLGFLLPQQVKSLYNKYFPKDKKQNNLNNWANFEEKYPNTFIRMYQFWVCKINI